jgi:hypothetical protein
LLAAEATSELRLGSAVERKLWRMDEAAAGLSDAYEARTEDAWLGFSRAHELAAEAAASVLVDTAVTEPTICVTS